MSQLEPITKEADFAVDSSHDEADNRETPEIVDKMTERKLMAKLDRRIIPMVMWMSVRPEPHSSASWLTTPQLPHELHGQRYFRIGTCRCNRLTNSSQHRQRPPVRS